MQKRVKRLRVLAGPNGSGKSTVIFHILNNYYCGHFLNADEIEKQLKSYSYIDVNKYRIPTIANAFESYINNNGHSWIEKAAAEGSTLNLVLADNRLTLTSPIGKYDAAVAADFLRYQLINSDQTFTFETVLSDVRKVFFLQEAISQGFKIYLYFVCTIDPNINKIRVANRVELGGHYVDPDKIESRYYSSLDVLSQVISLSHRTYLFDNSKEGDYNKLDLIAEIENGDKLIIKNTDVPWWVQDYVIDKLFV